MSALIRYLRLAVLAGFLAGTLLIAPAPAQAGFSGCSSDSDHPGELFVQASYGDSGTIFYRFFVDGPERRIVYEGRTPGSFAETLTGLTPGRYRWMMYREADGNSQTDTLATCTVYGLVNVPTVAGMTQSAAQSALVAKGLVVGTVSSAYSSTVAAGLVAGTSPAAGVGVAPGETIDIYLSKGPNPNVSVPNFVGQFFAWLDPSKLERFTIEIVYVDNAAPRRTVLAQSLRAGSSVKRGSTLVLTLSTGVAPIVVTPTPTVTPVVTTEPTESPAGSSAPPDPNATPTDAGTSPGGTSTPVPTTAPTDDTPEPSASADLRWLLVVAALLMGLGVMRVTHHRRRH